MGHRELRFDMNDPRFKDSQRITERVREEFEKRGRHMNLDDVDELIDDFDAGERVLKVKNPRSYSIPGCSPGGARKKGHTR